MSFPHNLLPIMLFPRMCCNHVFSKNVLLIVFFRRMCC
jgi:hypothetical protein